jgi:hypothetical protein
MPPALNSEAASDACDRANPSPTTSVGSQFELGHRECEQKAAQRLAAEHQRRGERGATGKAHFRRDRDEGRQRASETETGDEPHGEQRLVLADESGGDREQSEDDDGCDEQRLAPQAIGGPTCQPGPDGQSEELEEGLRSIAVPVVDREGKTVAAMNVGAQSSRVTMETMRRVFLPELRAAADEVRRHPLLA